MPPSRAPLAETEPCWHSQSPKDVLSHFNSDGTNGLTQSQVQTYTRNYGTNELQEAGGRSALTIFIDQFKNIMLLMLIAVALISGSLDLQAQNFPKDAIAILLIVILNGILGFLQESRAEKALAALKRLSAPLVRIIRNGQIMEVSSRELVPGDIILLEAGAQVAADARLLEASNLQAREAALTGEANPSSKKADIQLEADTPLGDRKNMVFQGTEIMQGRGKAVVTNTGMRTELGRIAAMLQSVQAEATPLQQRMDQLANVLVTGSMILVALVVVGGSIWQIAAFRELLEISLSMAVAVVPEGLPAVITVTLALGTQRMVRRQALIRKLPAVETLGSVTSICSDKTGTLTENKMVAQRIRTATSSLQVSGQGYEPEGKFLSADDGVEVKPEKEATLPVLLLAGVACNDAVLNLEAGEWKIFGDPTEGSLLSLAGKGGIRYNDLNQVLPRVAEFPFSSERKRMSVICQPQEPQKLGNDQLAKFLSAGSEYIMLSKGSPELMLERCGSIYIGGEAGVQPLKDVWKQEILRGNDQLATEGMRVLGLAYKWLSEMPNPEQEETAEQELVWLGLVGMLDAPRLEVKDAVDRCRHAGMRPIMITGDHQLTAVAIAQKLGIYKPGDEILTGQEIARLQPEELEKRIARVSVCARVAPEHKLRIVQILQKQDQIVAMTGDGVNDAPALKQADIGIAMGITGTDVSKEASDMVLLDDNFTTIVAAVEEGRVVYTNIRRFIKYILGSNIGEVFTVAAAPLLLPVADVPLTPLQILWMNLVTDGLPALALALEPPEPRVMERPPFDPRESIFARGLGFYIVRIGVIFTILTLTLMGWAYYHAQVSGDPERWKTMVFTTLCIAQMGHAIAVRSHRLTLETNPFSNLYVLGAVLLTTVLQLMLIYITPLRDFFGTEWLNPTELAICFGFSALMFVWIELEKIVRRIYLRWRKT
jgi:Ca2+-transporting ATPase